VFITKLFIKLNLKELTYFRPPGTTTTPHKGCNNPPSMSGSSDSLIVTNVTSTSVSNIAKNSFTNP